MLNANFLNDFTKSVTLIDKTHKRFQRKSTRFNSIIKTDSQRAVVNYYNIILDLTDDCIILFKKNRVTSIPIILRTILECFVHLIKLIDDQFYYFIFLLVQAFNTKLKRDTSGNNKLTPIITSMISVLDEKYIFKKNHKLTKRLSPIKELIESIPLAGESLYSFYEVLSSYTHQDFSIVFSRYDNINCLDDLKTDRKIELSFIIHTMISSSEAIYGFFGIDNTKYFSKLRSIFNKELVIDSVN